MRKATLLVCLAFLCASLGSAGEGEAAKPPARPRFHRHTLAAGFAKFSWQQKRRPWYEHVLWYLPSRAADLIDCVGIEIGAGVGGHFNLHATRFLQVGYGYEESYRVGLMSRYPITVAEELGDAAFLWYWKTDVLRQTVAGRPPDVLLTEKDVAAEYHKEADPLGIGFSLFPGILGISVELKPHEVFDFLKGFLTIDSLGDDL